MSNRHDYRWLIDLNFDNRLIDSMSISTKIYLLKYTVNEYYQNQQQKSYLVGFSSEYL